MSDRVQFEYHPDADQISAFVEHVLPAHERERMLGHLAVCPECRAVVALSLPEVEAAAPRLPAPSRKPWWSGWVIAWPAAAALAAIVLVVVLLPRGTVAPIAPAPNKMARANQPAPPTHQEQLRALPAAQASRGALAQPPSGSSARSAIEGSVAAKQNHATGVSSGNIAGLAVEDRNVAAPVVMAQAAPTPPRAGSAQGAGSGGGLGSAVGGSFAKAPSAVAEARLRQAAPTPTVAMAPAPAVTSAAVITLPAASSVAVAVSAPASSMPTVSSDAANIAIAENELRTTLLKHALPSRLPLLSMAAQGMRIVAIDARNAVFLSRDGGKHWKAIPQPWPGRAVKADLVVYPAGSAAPSRMDKNAGLDAITPGNAVLAGSTSGAQGMQVGALKQLPGASLSGTVKDPTGAVIAGATVAVTDTAAQTARTVVTNSRGRYLIDGLAPGAYRLEARAPGFNRQVLAAVAVAASPPTVQDIVLNVGAATQTVSVAAATSEIAVEKKAKTEFIVASQATGVFQITTDNGERWTSTDGVTWKRM